MTAEISGEKVVCRGVVHRLKEDGEREADCGRRDVPRFICRGKKRALRGALRARGAGKGGKR